MSHMPVRLYKHCLFMLQPTNLLMDEFGRVKVSDFGMARVERRFSEKKLPQVRMRRQPTRRGSVTSAGKERGRGMISLSGMCRHVQACV